MKCWQKEKIKNVSNFSSEFYCEHCDTRVTTSEDMGTNHRNHCPLCLWSKHVDENRSGDRKATCCASMEPIGLTFKQEGFDKYGKLRKGELMIIHNCSNKNCGKTSINRIAADDNPETILNIFKQSLDISNDFKIKLSQQKIILLEKQDEKDIRIQLFGR